MEFRILKYFLTVAKEESFSRAAEKLHLSQPTLSRQVKDLEDEYGNVPDTKVEKDKRCSIF